MFLFSLFFVFIASPATLLLRGGVFIILHFSFCVSDIGKMIQKKHFFVPKICTYQKKAVHLQRQTKKQQTTKTKTI